MKIILVAAATLCIGSANATLLNSVTAGAFTFENIQCSSGTVYGDCEPLTVSASQSGSGSTLTIADNGAHGTPNTVVQLSYEVVYTGPVPQSYIQSSNSTLSFLGDIPNDFILLDKDPNGTIIGNFEGLMPSPALSVGNQDGPLSTFDVYDQIFLGAPTVGGGVSGTFATTYAAVSTPEPKSFGLFLLSALSLLFIRAGGIFERLVARFRRAVAQGL